MIKQNAKVFVSWGLMFVIGWCFGHEIGIGIVAAILLIVQVF